MTQQTPKPMDDSAELAHPDVLETYASIFEKRRRDPISGTLYGPTEPCAAAAAALRFMAAALRQPPQPPGDVGELSQDERYRISWLRAARVGSWEITAELLTIIDRLNSRLAELEKMHVAACGNADTNYTKLQAAQKLLRGGYAIILGAKSYIGGHSSSFSEMWVNDADKWLRAALTGAGEEGP